MNPLALHAPRPIAPAALGGLVIAFGLWSAALVLVVFNANRLYSLPMIAATLMPAVLFASRNPRLLMLMGLASTSVLGLSINFGLKPHMGGAPSFAIDLTDIFLVAVLFFLVRDRVNGLRRDFVLPSLSWWWLAAAGLGVITVIVGPFRSYAAFEVVRMLKCWLLMMVVANECVRERHFSHVVFALAATVLVNVLVAFLQYAVKHSLGLQALGEAAADAVAGASLGVYLDAGAGVYRVSALVGHPNIFGTYLAMLLPLLTGFLFTVRSTGKRLFLVATVLGGIVALVLTLSRTGWAAYALAMSCLMGFLFFHPDLRRRWVQLKWTLAAAMGLVGLALSGPIILRWTASDSGALDFRWEWLGVAWKMILDKPLFGWGLNSFSYQIQPYVPYSTSKMEELFGPVWPVVHNVYFLVWTEQGLVGLVLFLGLNVHLLLMAWRNSRHAQSDAVMMLNIGIFAAVLAVMVDGLASFYMRVPGPARIFWVLAGLAVATQQWNRRTAALRQSAALSAQP